MFYPSLEKSKEISVGYKVTPISMKLMADIKTPIEVLRNIAAGNNNYFILESVASRDSWSRYTFLGYDPILTLRGSDSIVSIERDGESTNVIKDPVDLIRETLAEYKSPSVEGLPPFTGGLVGYFAYDFVKYMKPAPKLTSKNPEGFDDFKLMLTDRVIAYDHFEQKIYLICNIATDDIEQNYANGIATLKEMERLVLDYVKHEQVKTVVGEFSELANREKFSNQVLKLKEHINAGDVFQVVLSNRFSAPFKGSLLETYRVLRTTNPSPYMVYMHLDNLEIACASPETLVSLRANKLSTFPIAGTRPRVEDDRENARLEAELLLDAKELSEHDMLVDLARNDLGKVAEFGSVEVEAYREVKHYSHVMHITSKVVADIREDADAMDAVLATLPAGTLSGAPKIKACELIDALEQTRRGVYGGAMGYIDFAGNSDFCIAIRMAVRKDDKVFVQAGAGIVADSVPEKEYEECLHKAEAVLSALRGGRK